MLYTLFKNIRHEKVTASGLRKCTTCKIEKPADTDNFYRDKRANSGFSSQCIECIRAHADSKKAQNKEDKKYYGF